MELSRRNLLRTGLFGATALTVIPLGVQQTLAAHCVPTVCTIWAGQTNDVGTITVTNTNTHLTIDIQLTGGVVFDPSKDEQVKIWTGTDFTLMPQTNTGTPIPGQFPFKSGSGDPPLPEASGSSYSLTIALADAGIVFPAGCNSTLHVVAHLDVFGSSISGGQTAFGGCIAGATGRRWWFYLDHVICCHDTVVDPPDLGGCETAFAKGNWVWVTDSNKANPEKLPTLYLIRNRWGWAINLLEGGTFIRDLYAGAGLNNTAKGRKVGTVTVKWYNSADPLNPDAVPNVVTVEYQLSAGYRLAETHVYASNLPPPTTAPGRYGNNHDYFLACDNVTYDKHGPLPLEDDGALDICKDGAGPVPGGLDPEVECRGVWIIAHAVVCDEAQCE